MAVDAPPLGARAADVPAAHQRRRKHRAIGDAALVNRRVGSDDDVAHDRVHAVGADHRVGPRARAVLEGERHLAAALVEADQLLAADGSTSAGTTDDERLVQVAAVHAEIRRAEEALGHRQLAHDLAGVPLAVEVRVRLERGAADALLDADARAAPSSSSASSGCRRRCARSGAPARRRGRRTRPGAAWPPRPGRPCRRRRWRSRASSRAGILTGGAGILPRSAGTPALGDRAPTCRSGCRGFTPYAFEVIMKRFTQSVALFLVCWRACRRLRARSASCAHPRHRQHHRAALSRAEQQPLHGVPGDARGHHHERPDQPRLRALVEGGAGDAVQGARALRPLHASRLGPRVGRRRVCRHGGVRRPRNMLPALAPPAGNPPLPRDAVKIDANQNGLVERSEATGAHRGTVRAVRLQRRRRAQRRGDRARFGERRVSADDHLHRPPHRDARRQARHDDAPGHGARGRQLGAPLPGRARRVQRRHPAGEAAAGRRSRRPSGPGSTRSGRSTPLDFEHALTGHALAGTKKDALDPLRYLEDISTGVAAGIAAGRSLAEIQKTLTLDAYKGFERWDTTREAHIAAVYATLKGTRRDAGPATR